MLYFLIGAIVILMIWYVFIRFNLFKSKNNEVASPTTPNPDKKDK
jgi:hypothetical protein